ncbi:MAG: 30S ribosomal protein S21 [Candidatus Roizmanbacteria bacterium]
MVFVIKKKGESKDAIFRKFSKMFMEEKILDEVRKRMFYKKPSLVRKEEEKERLQNRHKRRFK